MSETYNIITDVTSAEFVALITANEGVGSLEPGLQYEITDFETKHYMMNGDGDVILDAELNPIVNTGATEPIIVTAISPNKISHVAKSKLYPNDIIHYDWNGENWKYDLAFAAWDEEVLPQWKGVIYFRHDTLNDVSMGHDFRKVLNRRWKRNDPVYAAETTYAAGDKAQDATGLYMSLVDDNTGNALTSTAHWVKIIDYAITAYVCPVLDDAQDAEDYIDVPCFYSQEADPEGQYRREVFSVHLKQFKEDGSYWGLYWIATILQNNVFVLKPEYGWYQVMGISAEIFCLNNTLLSYQEANVLGADFNNNFIGSNFNNNSIGAYFRDNFTGAYFYNNSIGAYFNNNSIGSNFRNNFIGSFFNNNSIGAYFQQNTIADNFNNAGGVDFTAATHVYAQYTCNLFTRVDGTPRLKYCDDTDTEIIVAANA